MRHVKKNMIVAVSLGAVLLCGWVGFAQIQEKDKSRDRPATAATKKPAEVKDPDEQAIRAGAAAFTTAYNAHDAKGVAELFALKAEFIDEDGNLIKGRDEIQRNFAAQFEQSPQCSIEVEITSIRVLTPHIALEEGLVRGKPTPDGPVNTSGYVVVHVKVDGRWVIASVSDVDADDDQLTAHDHLEQVAWLVGEWIEESAASTIKSTCRWDDNGNYLLMDFFIQLGPELSASGSMRIGWDPLSGQLKSWTFDADSGYAEGLWSQSGDEWIVKSHGVNSAGKVTSAVNVFRYIDKETISFRSYDRIVGGEPMMEFPENIIKRHSPAPAE